jgi:hypothetical protein
MLMLSAYRWGPYCIARMTMEIPQGIKDQINPPPSQESESQGSQAPPPAKTQEELDLTSIHRAEKNNR